MNTTLIKLFNSALVEKTTRTFAEVNAKAVLRGYLIHPDVCNDSVMKFLDEVTINPNATFYKEWNDVLSKSRFELLIDQLIHYATTYGTDFALGNGYVPNDGVENVPAYTDLKVIMPISVEDLYGRCMTMLTSGVALKDQTMKVVADFIIEHFNKDTFNIDEIKNREAQVYFSDILDIYPNQPINLFRYIVYKTTGKAMLIKDAATIRAISTSATPFDFSKLSEDNMKALASCFLRYKDLFLAFKHTTSANRVRQGWRFVTTYTNKPTSNAPYINKLRKLAVKYHKPMKTPFWNEIFSVQKSVAEMVDHMNELTAYKKVALMQSCLDRATALDHQFYLIRNQKAYLRTNYKPKSDLQYLMQVYTALRMSLIETLKAHATKKVSSSVDPSTGKIIVTEVPVVVRAIEGVKITLPSSEKSFIGNYPFGTSYKMTNDNYFGIYWRNEWGTRDYDLSFCGVNGNRIGWNSDYYNTEQNVVFSGDMTNASPEAAEVLAFKKGCPEGIIKVNQYNGSRKSRFQFFFGQEAGAGSRFDRNGDHVGYMVDPNTIKLIVDVPHEDEAREHSVGVCNGEEVVLMAVNTGNAAVSGYRGGVDATKFLAESIMHKSKCFVDAKDILAEAGFQIVDDNYTGSVDIDFKNLDKDSLIALMA